MTTAADPVAAPVAIRTRVRAAVDEAWQAAVASGALPAVEDDAAAPDGRGRAAGQRRRSATSPRTSR